MEVRSGAALCRFWWRLVAHGVACAGAYQDVWRRLAWCLLTHIGACGAWGACDACGAYVTRMCIVGQRGYAPLAVGGEQHHGAPRPRTPRCPEPYRPTHTRRTPYAESGTELAYGAPCTYRY
eukprot:199994-Rhodomonas_salina.1